jgi:tetratricopeptide (TPR) repeat protein
LNESTLAAALFSAASTNAASQTHAWSLARQGLAAAYRDANQPGEAESVCDEYVAAVRAGWHAPPDHYAMVLWTRSQLLELRRDTGAAIAAMQESVAQMERAAARGAAVDLAGGLLRLAELSLSGGELAAASELATRVLDEARAAGDSVASAGARAVLAHVARIEGRFVDAETLFRAALGPMLAIEPTWKAALLLRDFGVLYISCNDTANGVPLITRAVAMARDLYGIRSWQHATMLTTLAEVKSTAGPMHEAAPLFVDLADIATKIGSHELLARALRGSGSLYTRIGAWQAAEHMLMRALGQMALYSAPTEEVANVEADLAMVEARFDKYEAACERIDRVIATLREKRIGGGRLGSATRTKMWILGRMRRWDQAFDAARETSDAFEKELQQSVSIAPGRGRDQIADALYRQLDVVLSLALRLRTPAAIAEACERTLRWKGAALTWGAANVQALAVSTVAELKALRQDLIDVRRAMIRWSLSGPEKSTRRWTTLEELHRREEALDREINRHLASTQGRTGSRLHGNVQTVSAALPVSGALIDFVRYESIDFERGRSSDRLHRGNDRYAAFIVRAGAGPVLVDIGDAEAVDRAVSRFRSCVTGEADDGGIVRRGENVDDRVRPVSSDAHEPPPEDEWIPAGIDLRRLVFDPLLDAIGPCTRLSIAQHGELSRLPFAALPIDNGYLLDRYELTYLDTGRDLLRRGPDVSAPGAPLVIADPDFDLELLTVPASQRQQPFESLSETREEGAFVAAALGVAPLMGAEATEGRLRSAQSPRILHIATHGFFLADDRPPRPGNVADVATLISIPGFGNHLVHLIDKPRDIEEGEDLDPFTRLGRLSDPMLRSGVALAGSNTWASGAMLSSGDDGLLTAAEIALLDFTATDLAVLSACETGLGEVRRGEGVFGLRRAFAIAGAQTLVMSVWNIPSDQTRDLVIEFYRQLTAGKAVAQAFGDAQRAMRKIAPHPVNWAGLLCIGKPPA